MVDGRFLQITGRIKELYKLANGKYIAPAPLEDMLARSNIIAQACIHGANKPHNVAIIVPDFVELKKLIKSNSTLQAQVGNVVDHVELVKIDAIQALYANEIDMHLSESDKGYDRVHRFSLITEPFSQVISGIIQVWL
jgi:long-chain acyl-CoA synthetase